MNNLVKYKELTLGVLTPDLRLQHASKCRQQIDTFRYIFPTNHNVSFKSIEDTTTRYLLHSRTSSSATKIFWYVWWSFCSRVTIRKVGRRKIHIPAGPFVIFMIWCLVSFRHYIVNNQTLQNDSTCPLTVVL